MIMVFICVACQRFQCKHRKQILDVWIAGAAGADCYHVNPQCYHIATKASKKKHKAFKQCAWKVYGLV